MAPPLTEPDKRVLIALAETEERRAGQTVEVRFAPDAAGRDDQAQQDESQGQEVDDLDAEHHRG